MNAKGLGRPLAAAALVGSLAAVFTLFGHGALAQQLDPDPAGQPGRGGQGRFGVPPRGQFGGPGGFGAFGGGMNATMATSASRLFILQGRTLYAYDAGTLRLVAQTELPPPNMGPGGQGRPPAPDQQNQ